MNLDWSVLPGRLLVGGAVNLVLAFAALRSGSVRPSGFWGGLLVGITLYAGLDWRGFSILIGMFGIGTALTRHGFARKERMGLAEERRGARGASHAFANAGVAALAAVAGWATGNPLFGVAAAAALATASMDTAGSEIGPLYGRRTVSMKTFRPVPPGTDGAMSLEGTAAGLLAAAALGAIGALVGLYAWPVTIAVVLGALVGNLYEAMVGARRLLPHTWLNATNTLVGAAAGMLAAGVFR